MNEYYDEYEQGEAVKKWLADNFGAMIFGIVLGLGGLLGWQYWQNQQVASKRQAAEALATLTTDESKSSVADLDAFLEQVDNTASASLAAMHLAGRAMAQDKPEEAIALLQRVVENGEPEVFRYLAGLRLARVQLSTGDLTGAEAQLGQLENTQFAAMAAEVRGDLLLTKGDQSGARAAYQIALDGIVGGDRALLQMKLDDLAVAGES